MHVLYISGTYMPSSGGAEISMFSLLRSLVERGIRVTVFTSTRVPQTKKFSEDVGIDVQHVTTASLTQALAGFCAANKVDLIVTQHLWSDLAILFAKKTGIPSIIFARSHYGNLDLSKGGEYGCNHIIANS